MTRETNPKKQIEILAPAGSYESFLAAIHAGADAVYAGGTRFGARAFATNFTEEKLKEAIDYAHLHGRKLYLTVNTLLKEEEIDSLYSYLEPLYSHGLDAVIVQDIGCLKLIRQNFPDLEIHASTQMSITNKEGALFLQEQGVTRVVPAREISLAEIKDLASTTGMEVECFVHGALCYCYSGQCLLSSFIGGRSGNRGQCAQPCRLPYSVNQNTEQEYILSPKDICTLEDIPEMIEAGIYSFKIEGRMKRPEYVAKVTSIYRKYVDLYLKNGKDSYQVDPKDKQDLMDLYNRGGFSKGYYKTRNGRDMISIDRPNHAGVPAVKILSQKGRELTVQALTDIHKGDLLEMNVQKEHYSFGQELSKGSKAVILAPKGERYTKGTILNRVRNQKLLTEMEEEFISNKIQEPIKGKFVAEVGKPASLSIRHYTTEVTVFTENPVEAAQNQPMDEERIKKQLKKTGNTDFYFCDLQIKLNGNVFLPMQQLNELRRLALEKLKIAICEKYRRCIPSSLHDESYMDNIISEDSPSYYSVLVETIEQLKIVLTYPQIKRIYIDCNIANPLLENPLLEQLYFQAKELGFEVFLAMPHIFREDAIQIFEKNYTGFLTLAKDGVLIRNYESFEFLKRHKYTGEIITDYNLYVMNRYAKKFWHKQGIATFTAPVELNKKELHQLQIQQAELIAYGKLPVMISAQCVVKTKYGCTKEATCTEITDRRQKNFTVKNHCGFCYNIVYYFEPFSLLHCKDELEALHPQGIRIQFTTEGANEVHAVLESLKNHSFLEDMQYAQGHFNRGIF